MSAFPTPRLPLHSPPPSFVDNLHFYCVEAKENLSHLVLGGGRGEGEEVGEEVESAEGTGKAVP